MTKEELNAAETPEGGEGEGQGEGTTEGGEGSGDNDNGGKEAA